MKSRKENPDSNMIENDEDQQGRTELSLDQNEVKRLKEEAEDEFLRTAGRTFREIINSPERIIDSLLVRGALCKKIQGKATLLTTSNNKVPGEPDHIDPADISAILDEIDQQYKIGTNEAGNPTVMQKTGVTGNFTFSLNQSNLDRIIGDLIHQDLGFGISAKDIRDGNYSVSQLVVFNAIIFESFAHQADFAQKKKTENTEAWNKQFEKELSDELETYIKEQAYPQYKARQENAQKTPLNIGAYKKWYIEKGTGEDFSTFKTLNPTSHRSKIDNSASFIEGEIRQHITLSDNRKKLGKIFFDALTKKFPSSENLATFVTPTLSIPRFRNIAKASVVLSSTATGASAGAAIGLFFFGVGAIPGALIGGAIGLAIGGIAVAITTAREYFARKAELARRQGNNSTPPVVEDKQITKPPAQQSTRVVEQRLQQSTATPSKRPAVTLQGVEKDTLANIINTKVNTLNSAVEETFAKCISSPNEILKSILAREVISQWNGDKLSAPLKVGATMSPKELSQALAEIDRDYEVTFDQTTKKVMLRAKMTATNTESTKPTYGLTETTLNRALSDLKEHMKNEELATCSPSQLIVLDAVLSSSLHIAKTRIDEVPKEIKRDLCKINQKSLNKEIEKLYGKDGESADVIIGKMYQAYLSKRPQQNQSQLISKEDYVLDIFFSEICSSKKGARLHQEIENIASQTHINALQKQKELEQALAKKLITDFMKNFPNQDALVNFAATTSPTPNKKQ